MKARPARSIATLLCACALFAALPARAVMAGAAPDTPAARIDANTASSPWRGVVSIHANGSLYSGVLIGPRHVLTAGHVFDPNPAPETVTVQFNLGGAPIVRAAWLRGVSALPNSFAHESYIDELASFHTAMSRLEEMAGTALAH